MLQPTNKRGAIGISKGGKHWQGIYNFEDSTPIVLGPVIWEMLQENWQSLLRWGKDLLQYTYWDEYLNEGFCPYCGKFDVGSPCNIKGNLYVALEEGVLAPDPEAKFHSHRPKSKPLKSSNGVVDGLWTEWSYIVNPKDYMLEVVRSVRDKGAFPAHRGLQTWMQPKYRYHSVGLYSLFNDEPDWERVQQIGQAASAYYWDKYNNPQSNKKSFL